jgi:hypothetical protein
MGNKHICIGGPWAGKMIAHSTPYFRVPIPKEDVTLEAPNANEPVKLESIDSVVYVQQTFHTTRGPMFFWAPKGLGIPECIALMMLAYKKNPITEEEAQLK